MLNLWGEKMLNECSHLLKVIKINLLKLKEWAVEHRTNNQLQNLRNLSSKVKTPLGKITQKPKNLAKTATQKMSIAPK